MSDSTIDEFATREVLGVRSGQKTGAWITAEELTAVVQIAVDEGSVGAVRAICLTPDEALRFSRQISRIARRIRFRNDNQ